MNILSFYLEDLISRFVTISISNSKYEFVDESFCELPQCLFQKIQTTDSIFDLRQLLVLCGQETVGIFGLTQGRTTTTVTG